MGNEKQTDAWYEGFIAGRDSVFNFITEETSQPDMEQLKKDYIDWCNADK